ncbi:hypothetical protein ACFVVX_13265 [Kitasatospora sp. NPDC058170]|uniref:hypothetical protein n=1 Tax=Kitasatospora sp. NPDC058170 TaxID=3346364 RepID=UPI0036DE21D4
MTMHVRTRMPAAGALALIAALLLTACGSRAAPSGSVDGPGGDGSAVTDTAEIPWTTVSPSAITAVRTTDGGRSLVVDFPVASGAPNCARGLKGEIQSVERGTVFVRITYETRSADRRSGCTQSEPSNIGVPLPGPLGDQLVSIDNTHLYTARGATPPALRECGQGGCDPAPVGCTDEAYGKAMAGADSPKHSTWRARGCDGRWLVLDISYPTGPVCGDPGSGCDSHPRSQRWFYRYQPTGWSVITAAGEPGCAAVQRAEPQFPTALCAKLPAPGAPDPTSSAGSKP